ncbi:MAG: protein tyrosine phosphatase family protein [Nevskiales bacterium]
MSKLSGIIKFLQLSPRLATAGQPSREQFADIRSEGYELVINLAVPNYVTALADEAAVVSEHGMTYLHFPVVWEAPTQEDLQKFFAAMAANQDKKVFVHCAMNMRVSAFMFLYRVLRQGMPPEQAVQDLRKIWQPLPHWQKFIETMLAHPPP